MSDAGNTKSGNGGKITAIVLAIVFIVLYVGVKLLEERRVEQYYQPVVYPCLYNPETGEPVTTPCSK